MRSARFLINCLPCFLITLLISGCGYKAIFKTALDPVPVRTGNVITIRKVPPTNPTASTLVINWFGTSSYELRLGNISVLTDPFVTYKDPHKVISISRVPNKMTSDYREVLNRYGSIDPPAAIFIGHSHYDHMMDTVAALELPNWENTPVYGSPTTKHILAGYKKKKTKVPSDLCGRGSVITPKDKWSDNWCPSDTNGGWKEIRSNLLTYQSFEARHAYHFAGITLWDDKLDSDLKEPPRITNDFQLGMTYIHFFKFEAPVGTGSTTYTIGVVGAATEVKDKDDVKYKLGEKLEIFAPNNKLDVLILCVPGWDHIKDKKYPGNLLKILKPRVIVLTHYDNFFNEKREKDPTRLVPSAKFNEFLNKLQKDIDGISGYDEFESILIPGVGTTLYLNKPPSGVINVSRLSR